MISCQLRRGAAAANLGHHVIDEAVLIPDAQLFVFLLIALRLVDLLENLQEAAVVALQDRVLRRHVQRPARMHSRISGVL